MVRHTEADDRIAIDTHEAAVDAVQSGDVAEGDTVEVKYEDVNGKRQTETGTVVDTEVVEAGTEKGKDHRTYTVRSTFYRITYEVDGKNDHTLTGTVGSGDPPKIYTDVGGRHSDGGDRRTVGHAFGVTVEPADPFADVTGEHDDDYADTVEVVGTRDVERQHSDDVETTTVLRYTVPDPSGSGELSYDINAVRIGCPSCKQNTTALIRPDGSYECACGHSNDLTRGTLFHQQSEVEGVWEPY